MEWNLESTIIGFQASLLFITFLLWKKRHLPFPIFFSRCNYEGWVPAWNNLIICLSLFSVLKVVLGEALLDLQHIVMATTLINITLFHLLSLLLKYSLLTPYWLSCKFLLSSISSQLFPPQVSKTFMTSLHFYHCFITMKMLIPIPVPCQSMESFHVVKTSETPVVWFFLLFLFSCLRGGPCN